VLSVSAMRFSGHPSLDDHINLLGLITHYWNNLEVAFAIIPWLYSDDKLSGLFINRLSARDLLAATGEIMGHREPNARVRSAVEFAISALNIIRENRNILVHSLHIAAENRTDVAWVRQSKSNPIYRIMTRANLRDLRTLYTAMMRLDEYLDGLIGRIDYDRNYPSPGMFELDKRPALPRRFPLPRKLEQIDPRAPRSAKRQPRSSRK
jgi:hypothetical protein